MHLNLWEGFFLACELGRGRGVFILLLPLRFAHEIRRLRNGTRFDFNFPFSSHIFRMGGEGKRE